MRFMRVRNHYGFGHGLAPGVDEDINCTSCRTEKADGMTPDITSYDAADFGAAGDGDALDAIQEMLRDPEWGVGMLEDIAELVTATGREVRNYPDDRSTWGRH